MSKKSDKKLKRAIESKIVKFLVSNPQKHYSPKQIAKHLGIIQPIQKKLIARILENLFQKGKVKRIDDEKYQIKDTFPGVAEAVIEFTASGAAYIITPVDEDDIYIDRRNTGKAMHGDIVKYAISKKSRSGKKEGKVTGVVKRNRTEFVGTIEVSSRFAFVRPDNKKLSVDFYIDLKKIGGAKDGDKVLIEMTDWPEKAESPYGKVIKVLGQSGETDTEINAIMEDFQLPYEFPNEVLAAAQDVDVTISKKEIAKRRDFRSVPTFTIDPYDAKDFDDALSFQVLENGNVEVGVHIADVSHYVTPGSIIDKEAVNRATSVYLVDRVVPMLPEVLSNFVCSLRPNEEKLCFSAVFELDDKARIKKKWFGRTVIKSIRRFTYEEAQERIETKEGDYQEEINTIDRLAKILRKKRMNAGALDVFSREVKFRVSEEGKPVGVMVKTSKDAHKLIEEFMLLANRSVSRYVGEKKTKELQYPNIYRIHDEPSDQKLADLRFFLDEAGYTINEVKGKPISYALNGVMKEAQKNNELEFIAPMIIRSMAKAEYSPHNIGHYGLAFEYYSHFTSPIRRYPDLETHRILQNFLDQKPPKRSESDLESSCKHFSTQEKKATDAERASIKFMQVLYMSDKVGKEFDGVVSGVAKYGIFVEDAESRSEGLIRVRDIDHDHFHFEDDTNQFVGRDTGIVLRMGTKVRIKVIKADLINRLIDFELKGIEDQD